MYDNSAILGDEYIALQESAYQAGTSEYRRFVIGERGIATGGDPVFGAYFDAARHVHDVAFNPVVPLCESLDFETRHPCVTWAQFAAGEMIVLGGVMGENMALEEFLPIVEDYRAPWFPGLDRSLLRQTCDPAGAIKNPHGSDTGLQILQAFGVNPTVRKDANHPPVKDAAMQKVVGYLLRRQPDGAPCFVLNPRFVLVSRKGRRHQPVLQKAFEGGWTYDLKRNYIGTAYPHLRPTAKDGFYEHPCDSTCYNVTAFAPPDPAAEVGLLRHESAVRQACKLLERAGTTPTIPRGEAPEVWARAILAARAKADRERDEDRALRARQKDHDPYDDRLRARVRSRVGGVGIGFGPRGFNRSVPRPVGRRGGY